MLRRVSSQIWVSWTSCRYSVVPVDLNSRILVLASFAQHTIVWTTICELLRSSSLLSPDFRQSLSTTLMLRYHSELLPQFQKPYNGLDTPTCL